MKIIAKIFFLLLFLKSNLLFAEIVKPNNGIEPYQVIKILTLLPQFGIIFVGI